MSTAIVREWHFLWYAVAVGAVFAWIYDNLRLWRRLVNHTRFMVDLEDLLYWICCFIVSFVLLYYGNQGVIRAFAVFGAAIGMFLYCMTVGRIYVKYGCLLIRTVCSPFRTLFRIVKNVLTRIINHFTIKLRVYKMTIYKRRESKHASQSGKRQTKKKTCISTQKE